MDSALHTIDTELMNLQQFLGSNTLLLTEKQEKLQRLEKALNELTETKAALEAMEKDYLRPEFTLETFAGKNSKQFNDFRHENLADSFALLTENQMNWQIENIQRQIAIYQGDISRLETAISSLESQQNHLNIKREKEIAEK